VAVVNQNDVFTARTESQLLPTCEAKNQKEDITAEQIEQFKQIKSVDLQLKISYTGQS
jgi:hypothetical protein